jgi:hypothetical protein
MPVISATYRAEVERSQPKADLGKVIKRSYLKNKLKAKGLEAWPRW